MGFNANMMSLMTCILLQVGYDPHAQMRAPLGPGLGIPGGKP